jgi:hypothetical protein
MYWSDGSYYKGGWQKGIQHGKGNTQLIQVLYASLVCPKEKGCLKIMC